MTNPKEITVLSSQFGIRTNKSSVEVNKRIEKGPRGQIGRRQPFSGYRLRDLNEYRTVVRDDDRTNQMDKEFKSGQGGLKIDYFPCWGYDFPKRPCKSFLPSMGEFPR